MISEYAANSAIHGLAVKADRITMNSPTKPDVNGRPQLAIANSTQNAANHGITLASPPYAAISRVCRRSYITPMQVNSAPDTKPCEIICTTAPCTPSCAMDEYATSFFMSGCTSAT